MICKYKYTAPCICCVDGYSLKLLLVKSWLFLDCSFCQDISYLNTEKPPAILTLEGNKGIEQEAPDNAGSEDLYLGISYSHGTDETGSNWGISNIGYRFWGSANAELLKNKQKTLKASVWKLWKQSGFPPPFFFFFFKILPSFSSINIFTVLWMTTIALAEGNITLIYKLGPAEGFLHFPQEVEWWHSPPPSPETLCRCTCVLG